MVLSAPYHEDDPRSVYKAKKLKATVSINTGVKSSQTGVIKSDPDGTSIPELQNIPTNSTYRSHTGHGRYEISPSVQSAVQEPSVGSNGSHTIDPSFYTAGDVRQDRSIAATSRSAPIYAREQSEPVPVVYSRSQAEPEVKPGSSVASRLAAYRKNAKIVSSPKVSLYSVAANKDRYVQSPMKPVAPGTPVVEVAPVVAERSLSSGSRSLNVEAADPPAEESLLSNFVKPLAEATSSSSSKSGASSRSGASSKKSAKSNKKAEPEPTVPKDEEQFDKTLEDAIAQSQEYWAKVKQKQRHQKRMQKAQEGFMVCGGGYDDDSTVESNSEMSSDEGSWNLFDAILLGQTKEEAGGARAVGEVGLVSKEELLCDFEDSGVDKIKELHQYLKSFASDGVTTDQIVGRDIVATWGNGDDESSKSSVSSDLPKMGFMARFAALLAAHAAEFQVQDEEGDDEEHPQKEETEGTYARTAAVHTVRYNPRRETGKRNMRIATAQYLAAVAASNSSVTSSEKIAKASKSSDDTSSERKGKKSKTRANNSSRKLKSRDVTPAQDTTEPDELKIIGPAPGSTLVPTESAVNGTMIEAGSAVSTKSVRFSEKVQTHEPEEVQAPDVPSLMDDQPEEDETSSVESSPEPVTVVEESDTDEEHAPKKKKNFFKKLFPSRRGKRKNKKRVHAEPFQPTLQPMDEEVENESDAPAGDESVSSAATAKSGNKSTSNTHHEVSSGVPHASEGFELIAGCTKTGKKAIMIAKAKNERKRLSEDPKPAKQTSLDPPPSTTASNDNKDAAPVVANDQNVSEALDVIQQHANKHGVTERELLGHVEAKDNASVDHADQDTFLSEGDSLFHGGSAVASKLLNMFDSMFAVEGTGEEDLETVDS